MIVLGRDRVQTATSYAYHARGRGAGGGSEGDLTDVHTDYIMGLASIISIIRAVPPPRGQGGKMVNIAYLVVIMADSTSETWY